MRQYRAFIIGVVGAFIGALALIVFLYFWQYPLLLNFGLERAAWEEMRVLAVSALVGVIVGFSGSKLPKLKAKTVFIIVVGLAVAFCIVWLIPLLMPSGSGTRLAWEEIRVVVVGILVGGLIGTTFGWAIEWGK